MVKNKYNSIEYQNELAVANKAKRIFDDTLNVLSDNVQQLYAPYISPYQEQKSNITKEGELLTEYNSLAPEKGVVDYIPKKDIYPSWIYNYMELLSMVNPTGKNDLLHLFTHTGQSQLPQSWCRDNYLNSLIRGKYIFTDYISPEDSVEKYSKVSQFKDVAPTKNSYTNVKIAKPALLESYVGSAGSILYTTETGIPMECISPLNKSAQLILPCKDITLNLVSDVLQAEPCFGLKMDGTSLSKFSSEVLAEFQREKCSLIQFLQQTDYVPNYSYLPLYPCRVDLYNGSGSKFVDYKLQGFEGFNIPYLLQRGDCLNSGIQLFIQGSLDLHTSLNQYVENLYISEKANFPPIGMPEPLYQLVRIKYDNPTEKSATVKSDNKFVSLRGDEEGYYLLYDFRTNTCCPMYLDFINRYSFSTYAYLLPPIFVWAYLLIKDNPTSIATYNTLQEFLNSNIYHEAKIKVLLFQSQFITTCNEYIDAYNESIKAGAKCNFNSHEGLAKITSKSKDALQDSYKNTRLQLDGFHLSKTIISTSLPAHQSTNEYSYIDNYIKAQILDSAESEEYAKYLKNNYKCDIDYEEILKSYD